MSMLRKMLDKAHPHFTQGGKFQKFYALYEMVDTMFYSPADTTRGAPHIRDALDLKRVMIIVVLAAVPCALMGMWNVGFQANSAMASLGIESAAGWRGAVLDWLGVGYAADNALACVLHGLLYFLPIYIVTMAAGGFWEVLFAIVRKHEVNEGFFVTGMLYALILPATIPLWQVALGISFGVVIGKEVFGGTGKNILNPALVGRAFLYFAYPVQISGDAVWTAVDGFSGATALGRSALNGMEGVLESGLTWTQAFVGQLQGSLGETSTLAILLGAVVLMYSGIASWRIILGTFLGMVLTVLLYNAIGSDTNPMFGVPWYWHLVLGGFAFGMVFMATDPVTATTTDAGRWIYGLLIGVVTVVIRVSNPAYPEGIMLAILFANVFAPLIDYVVIRINIRRRARRLVR